MEDVPQEITEQIINHLHDRHDLKSCALVCKAWIPASRYHLFHSIRIGFIHNSPKRALNPLIQLLDNPHCTFSGHVRRLEVWSKQNPAYDRWLDPLVPHLTKLSSVTSLLCGAGGPLTIKPWSSLLSVQQFADQITDLTLYNPLFRNFDDYLGSISAFPSLVTLECAQYINHQKNPIFEDDRAYAKLAPMPLRVLKLSPASGYTISLHCTQLTITLPMVSWLLQSRVVLHTFKLGRLHKIPSAVNFTILLSYLQFLGSSLQVFHVEFIEAEDICA